MRSRPLPTSTPTTGARSPRRSTSLPGSPARPLHRRLTTNDHDLVVASVFPYFPVLAAKLAALGPDTPLVTTWHEVWRDYWESYLGGAAPFGKAIEQATARLPQQAIAVSGITADRLAEIGPARESIDVVPNGIDVDRIQSAPLPETHGHDAYDVLFAGRLIEDKNVALLLDAFDAVADRTDATLGIIGDGPEAARLQRQARGLEHADRIDFLGFLEEYDHVLGHMRAARVFASPSTREGFGITYAEAMAADCTVIAAAHPESAASEVLGDAGMLVRPERAALAETLRQALSGARPTTAPRERAAAYDWDSVATRAETIYEDAATEC